MIHQKKAISRISRWSIAGIVLLGLLVFASFAEWYRRIGLYWYDVSLPYRYQFSDARAAPATIDASALIIPGDVLPAESALLELEVTSTFAGYWFEPAIELAAASGEPIKQSFERGAKGIRYINLGGLLTRGSSDGVSVAMSGSSLRWNPSEARLLLFDRPPTEAGPVLVVAPHPDDAEIAAFGLYSDTDSWIVTVTSGNTADERMDELVTDPAAQSALKGELRSWDSIAVPRWGDVPPDRAVNLGYFTLTLKAMYANPGEPVMDGVLTSRDIAPYRRVEHSPMIDRAATSTWTSLVDDLAAAIAYVQPRTIVAPHPVLDRMVEHKLTTIALLEAIDRVGKANRTLLLYSNHAPGSEYFPFGPADSLISLPPWTGEAVRASGFYSHRLTEDKRIRKLYALEAQHDLRPAPRFVSPDSVARFVDELAWRIGDLLRDPTDTYSYMRRAARPNEPFLVLHENDAQMLRLSVAKLLDTIRARGPVAP